MKTRARSEAKKPARMAALILAMLVPLAPSVLAAEEVDYDPDVDFTEFGTFYVLETVRGPAAHAWSELDERRIRSALVEELEGKGLEEVAPRSADLRVRVKVGSDVDVVAVRTGPRRRGPVRRVRDRDAVLTVEVSRGDDGELVWRGWDDFDPKPDGEKRMKQIRKVVARILDEFPPD